MKITITGLLALAVILPLFSIPMNADDWAQFAKYEDVNRKYLAEKGNQRPDAVFIGSSIIELWTELDPSFFERHNYLGRGISGQSTYQMLLRLRDDVINLKPTFMVLYGGSNDIAENTHTYNEDRTLGNIISISELARANNIPLYLSSVLPAGQYYWRPEIQDVPAKIVSLNKRLRAYAEANGIPYLDFYSVLVDEDGAMKKEYTQDGVHPNAEGYKVMEEVFLNTVGIK